MFTGIIEKVAKTEKIIQTDSGAKISFHADFDDIKLGDSIACNGVCLTITKIENYLFEADIMPETLKLTNLKNLKTGDLINLERAMKAEGRLNGHIVQGHVDCIAKVLDIKTDGFSKKIRFLSDTNLIIKKGSIAINGVSLTISDVKKDNFEVSLIPATIENTNLKNLQIDDIVNIEYDILGKYIQKFTADKKEDITLEFLKENDF